MSKEGKVKKSMKCARGIAVFFYLCIAFATARLLSLYVVQFTLVHGNSMEPAISDGDYLLVGKLNYQVAEPERFDVIVWSKDGKEDSIKRLIGMPGEHVRMENGAIYINGEVLKENYGLETIEPDAAPMELYLGEDEYFVLGDNRQISLDSRVRTIGAVKRSEIRGNVLLRLYPFYKAGVVA